MPEAIMNRNNIKIWLQATRPFSFTASITPVLIGAAWASLYSGEVAWVLLPVFLLCSLLIHAATNLISDYEDFKRGVDQNYTYGSSGVLVADLMTPEKVKKGAYVLFAVAFLLGLLIVFVRGWPILILGSIGIAAGYFYTVSPVGYKYKALGDVCVFLFMGVLLVVGAYLALTGQVNLNIVLISIPISLLVTAILHANNVRDIQHDREAGVQTLAGKMGHQRAQTQYAFLVLGAYVMTMILVVLRIVSPWSLLVFITLPLAVKNITKMRASEANDPQSLATLDVDTAKLHLAFGVIYVVSFLIAGAIG